MQGPGKRGVECDQLSSELNGADIEQRLKRILVDGHRNVGLFVDVLLGLARAKSSGFLRPFGLAGSSGFLPFSPDKDELVRRLVEAAQNQELGAVFFGSLANDGVRAMHNVSRRVETLQAEVQKLQNEAKTRSTEVETLKQKLYEDSSLRAVLRERATKYEAQTQEREGVEASLREQVKRLEAAASQVAMQKDSAQLAATVADLKKRNGDLEQAACQWEVKAHDLLQAGNNSDARLREFCQLVAGRTKNIATDATVV